MCFTFSSNAEDSKFNKEDIFYSMKKTAMLDELKTNKHFKAICRVKKNIIGCFSSLSFSIHK